MSFSDEYKSGYTGNHDPNVDVFSYSYQMGQNDRDREMRNGTYGAGGGGAGFGGGGAALGVLAVIIAFCAFVIALASYPVAAITTGIAFGLGSIIFNSSGAQANFLFLVFALMVPCYIVFVVAFNLEKKLGALRPYQMFRQGWRMAVGAFFVHTLGTGLHRAGSNPGLFEYGIDGIATVCAPFLMYLNSIRLDKKYELEPVRWRRVEMIMAPVKDRLVSRVDETILDTPVYRPKELLTQKPMEVQVANARVKLGDVTVPVANIKRASFDRERRGLLIAAGIVAPLLLIVFLGRWDEEYRGFFQLLLSTLGLAGGALLILWGAIPSFPAGRLQGPFRHVNLAFAKTEKEDGQVCLKFERPAEERAFLQAIDNGLKKLRNPEVAVAPKAVEKPGLGPLRRLTASFKF